ncbi:zinc finger protein 268 [Folsomia candida]|uniref:Zinc finger protein 81 n=1 Tax=Folsomia candida TaxID=158441 RepID=A0A226D4Y6_FOLCA|nr:zinc finger protein 268 [Folsomia candida]OXA39934.1 Zinc finger protein 81 [Folsomia candida]
METVNLHSENSPESRYQNSGMEKASLDKAHNYCFLCESLLQNPSSPSPLLAKKISLCKKFLQEIGDTEEKNYAKSCPTCLHEVRKVWHLNLAIITVKQQITAILKKRRACRKQQNPVKTPLHHETVKIKDDDFTNDQTTRNSNRAENYAHEDHDDTSPTTTTALTPCVKIETSSSSYGMDAVDVVDSIFVGGAKNGDIFAESDAIDDSSDLNDDDDNDTNFMEYEDVEVMPTFQPASPVVTTSPVHRRNHRAPSRPIVAKHKCLQCERGFPYRFQLAEHVRSFHEKIRYPCSVCGKALSSARHCAAHEATICGVIHPAALLKKLYVKLHPCIVVGCTKIFASSSNLGMHVASKHVGVPAFICSTCGVDFVTLRDRNKHEIECKIRPNV